MKTRQRDIERVFPIVLAFQVILVFFAPPISFQERRIFPSDVWCLIWTTWAMVFLGPSIFKYLVSAAAVLGLAYFHGLVRPPTLIQEFGRAQHYISRGIATDVISPVREFFIALRFLTWVWAAGLSFIFFRKLANDKLDYAKKILNFLLSVLGTCIVVASISLVLTRVSPALRDFFGRLYHYDPNYEYWINRSYGVFPSPVEGSAVLAFGALLYCIGKSNPISKIIVVAFAVCGIVVSRTISPLFGLAAVFFIYILGKEVFSSVSRGSISKNSYLAGVALALVVLGLIFLWVPESRSKIENLNFRLQSWKIFFEIAQLRWDYLLFGFGFIPYHADNMYIFLFSRGGLFLLAAFALSVWLVCKKFWKTWSPPTRLIPLYLLFVGLLIDAILFRHVAALFFSVAAPLLALRKNYASFS